jgi:predicted DCC family thiol-disulfide oxidoreductase YuxK
MAGDNAMARSYLLYDGECPACRTYVTFARLRETWPEVELLDARDEPDLVARLRAEGYEINDGLVLRLGDTIHYGAEATRVIGAAAGEQGPGRRLVLAAIGTAPWSRRLYPWLNRGRKLLLAALGRRLIG